MALTMDTVEHSCRHPHSLPAHAQVQGAARSGRLSPTALLSAPNPFRDGSQSRRPGADGRCQAVNEAAVRRLDGPTVQQNDRRAC
jgi:hypothetical protein